MRMSSLCRRRPRGVVWFRRQNWRSPGSYQEHGLVQSHQIHSYIDTLYASAVGSLFSPEKFFQEGFGDLDVVNFRKDVDALYHHGPMMEGDPVIDWKRVYTSKGRREKTYTLVGTSEEKTSTYSFRVYQACFQTPVLASYEALPEASRYAHAKWIVPVDNRTGDDHVQSCVVHLAATGDHGFSRRESLLAIPLAKYHGIASVILESPYYGLRKPSYQSRSKLKYVSDLLLLGKATIEETLVLLQWISRHVGMETALGVSGISMGGVHSCMVASLFREKDIALVPLLAPRSAAAAYCRGALFQATGWNNLLRDVVCREQELVEKIRRDAGASQPSLGHSRVCPDFSMTAARDGKHEPYQQHKKKAVHMLEAVLETYTDITRFPTPSRPDAAVLVAATDDAYVGRESVEEMHRFLQGSELRWVPGGHVSSFFLHHGLFRKAIRDALMKL